MKRMPFKRPTTHYDERVNSHISLNSVTIVNLGIRNCLGIIR